MVCVGLDCVYYYGVGYELAGWQAVLVDYFFFCCCYDFGVYCYVRVVVVYVWYWYFEGSVVREWVC